MADERRRILELLAAGRISAEEADRLLSALNPRPATPEPPAGGETAPCAFKYLRVVVEPGPGSPTGDKVNIRVPFKLIRAGLKWMSFIPPEVRDRVERELQGRGLAVDLAKITPAELEELVTELRDLTVEVEGRDRVRIFCE